MARGTARACLFAALSRNVVMRTRWLATALLLGACSGGTNDTDNAGTTGTTGTTGPTDTTGADDPDRATLVHSFGTRTMAPFAESEPCAVDPP